MKHALCGATIFDGDKFKKAYCVILEHDKIKDCIPQSELPANIAITQLPGGTLAPGLIDLQVNGGGGVMFNQQQETTTLKQIISSHRRYGTTSIAITLLSDSIHTMQAAISAVDKANEQNMPGLLAVHLEGPFFNPDKAGVHQQQYLHSPSQQEIDWLCQPVGFTRIITLAPETMTSAYLQQLSRAGYIICAGHSQANTEQITQALQNGVRGFTHLFNAMSPLQSRDPGMVGAALANNDAWCSIIADGIHVHPWVLNIAKQAKPKGKLFFVSDAMATVGSEQNTFTLYNETIEERYGQLRNQNGNLAGSAITLIDAVRFCYQQLKWPLAECLRMASWYPAQFINKSSSLGAIRTGYQADLVHFNDELMVQNTWVNGIHAASKS